MHGKYNTTRNSKIEPYAETIKRMLKDGSTFRQIEESIKQDGYDGASSTIRMYTTRERKLMKEAKGDIGEFHDIVKTFKSTLFSKEPDELEKWMKEAERLGLEQINSFVNGLRRDLDAVKKQLNWIIITDLRKEASIN